jgi:hypothetical protein
VEKTFAGMRILNDTYFPFSDYLCFDLFMPLYLNRYEIHELKSCATIVGTARDISWRNGCCFCYLCLFPFTNLEAYGKILHFVTVMGI